MVTSVVTANGVQDNYGHCSRCGKIWTLEQGQGICPWCGHLASCQTSRRPPRSIKSSSGRSRKQALVHSNGYDHLEGAWLTYYKVASRFSHKAMVQDREDLLHDIITTLADAERNNGHKPFTEAVMYRIASLTVSDYWFKHYELTNGLDCRHCSQLQREKCKKDWLYSECPKAIKLEYFSQPVIDGEGNTTELGELIADDRAIDLNAWGNNSTWEIGYPQRLVQIAHKLQQGEALTHGERTYLCKWRKREQNTLFKGLTF